MRKIIFLTAFLLCATRAQASIANVYVAQAAAGLADGSSCANALAVTFFNTAGNWGAGATQIGQDTTVHLCGTFTAGAAGTTMLTTQASGASGHPITIIFETGAVLTSPSWGANGAIFVNQTNFITVDGGTNGIIQNTASGTLLANKTTTSGIEIPPSNNVTIKNLSILNIYVHNEGTNENTGNNSTGIHWCGSNILITNNIITGVGTSIGNGANSFGGCSNRSVVEISSNTLRLCNHCIAIGINSGTITGILVHDNDISDTYNWDEPDNQYHHNYIFTFGDPAGTITGDYYNNYMHGISSRDSVYGGSHTTALMFLEYDNINSRVFNNLFTLDTGDLFGTANGLLTAGGSSGPESFYNNTFAVSRNNGQSCVRGGNNSVNIQNNVLVNCGSIVMSWDGTIPAHTINNNIYYSTLGQWIWDGQAFINYATWKTDCVCDAASTNGTNPNLTVSYKLSSGSVAIGAGANLTSLGITALNSDKAGVARPGSGAWDAGAYQFSSSSSAETITPSSLAFGNQAINTSSAAQNLVLKNTGTTNLVVSGVTASSDYSLTQSPNPCGTLAASASCTIAVTFLPTVLGTDNGTVTITDNEVGSPHVIQLTGAGLSVSNIAVVHTTICTSQLLSGNCTIPSTAAGNELVMGITFNNGSGACVVASINGAGAWASAGARSTNATPNSAAEIWAAPNVANATTVVTINTTPATGCSAEEVFWEVSKIDTLDVAAAASNVASSSTPSGAAVTTTQANEFVVGILNYQGSVTGIFSGNVFTNDSVLQGNGWAHYLQSAAGTRTPQWQSGAANTSNGSTASYYFSVPAGTFVVVPPLGLSAIGK